jgi:hypothetical protein
MFLMAPTFKSTTKQKWIDAPLDGRCVTRLFLSRQCCLIYPTLCICFNNFERNDILHVDVEITPMLIVLSVPFSLITYLHQ